MQVKKIAITLFKLTICLLFTASFSLAHAQGTGKLTGKITDQKTGEALIGASILVEGTQKGAATNVNGEYIISDVPAGAHSVLVRYVGYQNKQISDIEIKAGQPTILNIIMAEAATQQLAAVTVKATFRQESANALYSQQKNSTRVSDGISAESIRRSPDRNTGEVLKRVSGTSIQDGKFVVVRGLGDRYNTTMLNNAVLPSSEPDRKAFSFDVIPSSLVDNIVISKTATPDLPGDFAGGAVQITTKDFPEVKVVSLQLGVYGNTQTTFKDFKQGTTGSLDFLGGYDNGSRELPSTWKKLNKSDYLSYSASQQVTVAQQFKNTYGLRKQFSGYPGQNLQLVVGNTKTLSDDSKFGYIASVNYSNNIEKFNRERDAYTVADGQPIYNLDDELYNFTNTVGALLNLSYSHKNSKYSLKNLYNNVFTNNYAERSGAYVEGGDITNVRAAQTDVTRNGLISTVFEGQHFLPTSKINIDYNLSYGYSYRKQPDQRILEQFQRPSDSQNWYVSLSNFNQAAIQNAGRLYSDLGENIYGGKVNVSIPYKLFKQTNNKFKFGYLTQLRDRDYSIETLGYAIAGGANGRNIYLTNGLTVDNIFSNTNLAQYSIGIFPINGYNINYNGKVYLNAGYLMTENKLSDDLRLIAGARVERFEQTIQQPGAKQQKYLNTDVLPSVNLIYALNAKSNLRIAGSQTVARPELRELAQFSYYDFVTDFNVVGNPNLKRTLITNADIRYEFFPAAGQIMSVSGFYKHFDNAIERTNDGNRTFSFANAKSAYDFGAELEFRRRLDILGSQAYLKNLTFYVNASYIKSRVTVANSNPNRPLQGQSPYLLNGGLQYVGSTNGLVLNLLYNKIGERIAYVGENSGRDIYENPRDLLDFQVGKRIIKNKAEIKLNISDIFAQPIRLYTNYDNKKVYNASVDKNFQSTKPGRNISLQFVYNF